MINYKMRVSYDGTKYLGWQKTKLGKSIEESLEKALSTLLQTPISLQAASRTDRGVHARGQVVNFMVDRNIDLSKLKRGVNALLDGDISVSSIEIVPISFHPTLDNTGKEYHYFLCNSPRQLPFYHKYSWHYPYPLHRERIEQAIPLLLGKKDFSTFCNERKDYARDPVCDLTHISLLTLDNNRLQFVIRGDRFLYKMVRNIVGTLMHVGSGKISLTDLKKIIDSNNRSLAGVTAPAKGLFLHQVFYT